jgi:hypothetical protein
VLNENLRSAIAKLPGIQATQDLEVLQCSSAHATGAIIFHVRTGRRWHVDAVIKTPRDPRSNHAIETEWNNLVVLSQDSRLAALLPPALKRFEVDGAVFYAYGGIPGRTMFSRFRDRVFVSKEGMRARFGTQALDAALRLHATHTRMVSGTALARDLQESFRALASLVKKVPEKVERHVEDARIVLENSGLELPAGRIHGDFSPYNLLTTGRSSSDCTGIIDWEHYEHERPQHVDVFRFIGSCELMGRTKIENAATLRRMSDPENPVARTLLAPWLKRMAPSSCRAASDPGAYAALWTHYWVCAAHREQDRQLDPAEVGRTTYFPGLCELHAA